MLQGRRARIRALLLLTVGAGAVTLALVAYGANVMRSAELQSVDTRFSIRGTERHAIDPVVVAIDDRTFGDFKNRIQWPFPRSYHGRVIDRILRDHPRAIVYDIQFTEPTKPAEDNALIDAVARAHGRIVLATTEVDEGGHSNVFGGEDVLRQIGARSGNAVFQSDPGGAIRRLPYRSDGLKSLSIVTAEMVQGRPIPASALGGERGWIDYAGPPATLRTVSFSRVYQGRTAPGLFRGKVVVVGPSAPSLQDVHPTSTSGGGLMAGAEVQANAISTALRDFPLRSPARLWDIAAILLLGLLAPALSLRFPPLRTFAFALAVGIAYTVGAQLAFNAGWVVSFAYPLLSLVLASVGSLAVHYLLAAFERERVRMLFSAFVPESVVDQVLARADDGLRLGGVEGHGTVMFTDLRSFTSFSEKLPAAQVIDLLNQYLSEMSDAILSHGGTLVSYMGDGIFAVFGAPLEQPDHADRALATAREMLDVRLPRFNEYLAGQGFESGFKMGIGLNTGSFMAGNVGSERRLEFTAIGDTTNTASRIEGMTKGTPHSLFIAESTRAALTHEAPDLVFVDEMPVRGREEPIRLWSINGAGPASQEEEAPAQAAVLSPT
jgi:adenylate cyclase